METNGKERARKITIIRAFLILVGIFLGGIGMGFLFEVGIFLIPIGLLLMIIGSFMKPPDFCPHCYKIIEKYEYRIDPEDENKRILSCPFCKEYIKCERIVTEDEASRGPCGLPWWCWCIICCG
ncbi:MAG: hypothetical protein JW776_16885 [Candidatus Lokiarchaeota archaeon]|nr:hypothetical protein [Candidatus Lokiarchaeota archaeon]